MANQTIAGQIYQEDISVLLPLLHGVIPCWEQFGCHLPVNYDSIKEIKRGGYQKSVKDKLIDVLDWYKCRRGPKRWGDIIKALKDIRNFDLASRVPQAGDVPVQADNYISLMLEQYRLKEVTADWKSFGMQLGIPYMELNAFDQGRNTPRRCMEELLIVWIQCRGKNANMSAIIKACEGVGDYALADRLKENNDIKRIMRRTTNIYRNQGVIDVLEPNNSIASLQGNEVGEKAKTILLSNRSTIKDIIVSAGLLNIIYVCEEKELITSSAKSILVSNTTGQTEDGRAYQLLDSITSVVGYSTDQMDVFLCVLYKNGGIAGKDLAKRMAEEFLHIPGGRLELFNNLVQNDSRKQIIMEIKHEVSSPSTDSEQTDGDLDPKRLLDKSPVIEDVLQVVTDDCDCQQFRKALKIPIEGSLKDAISYWIKEEPSDVTWRNLMKGLRDASKTQTVRFILANYLKQPSVYKRYIDSNDFVSLEDLGI